MMTDPAPSDLTQLWRSLRGLLRREYPLLILLLVGLVVAEITLRVVRPDLAGLTYDRNYTGGHPVQITERGLRVPPEVTVPPRPRILAVGDSTTYGTGVAAEATWPLQLQDRLGVRVGNAGFEGASLTDFKHRLETVWDSTTELDTVVLLVTGNMVSFTDFHWTSGPRALRPQRFAPDSGLKTQARQAVQASALWKGVSLAIDQGKYAIGLTSHRVDPSRPLSPLMAYGWEQPDLAADAHARMWERFGTRLAEFDAALAARDICLIVGFLPPRFMLSDDMRDNLKFVPKGRLTTDAEARVAALVNAMDRPFVSLNADLQSGNTEALYIPADYTHLNARGHAIAGKTLAARIDPILKGEVSCAAD